MYMSYQLAEGISSHSLDKWPIHFKHGKAYDSEKLVHRENCIELPKKQSAWEHRCAGKKKKTVRRQQCRRINPEVGPPTDHKVMAYPCDIKPFKVTKMLFF